MSFDSLLRLGVGTLAALRDAGTTMTVVYSRGAERVTLQATAGTSLLRVDDGRGGTKIVRTAADFLVTQAALDFGGGPVTPAHGDTIDVTEGARTVRYEVAPPGPREPVYRKSDQYGITLRVHCRRKEDF